MNGDIPAVEPTTQHVRRAVDGDSTSLSWLAERFSPLLHAVAAHRLGPALQATYDPADVVQDVWAAVLPKLGALQLEGPRSTPIVLKNLTTAVMNRIRNLLERHLTRQVAGERGDVGLENLPDAASGILTKAMRAENVERMHQALES